MGYCGYGHLRIVSMLFGRKMRVLLFHTFSVNLWLLPRATTTKIWGILLETCNGKKVEPVSPFCPTSQLTIVSSTTKHSLTHFYLKGERKKEGPSFTNSSLCR